MDPKVYDEYINTKIEQINFDRVFSVIRNFSKNKNKIKILDLCCGTGIFPFKWLSQLDNVEYTGVDINKRFIEYAKKRLNKNKSYSFIVKDAVEVKLKDKFDIVLATSSYHHIVDKDKQKFLQNVNYHLDADGLFIVYEKILAPFNNKIQAVQSGTIFYLERIKDMLGKEKLNENQLFALFNEQYLTSIRKGEYKVDYAYFVNDIKLAGFKLVKAIKLWPKKNIFNNLHVGDFIFIIKKINIDK